MTETRGRIWGGILWQRVILKTVRGCRRHHGPPARLAGSVGQNMTYDTNKRGGGVETKLNSPALKILQPVAVRQKTSKTFRSAASADLIRSSPKQNSSPSPPFHVFRTAETDPPPHPKNSQSHIFLNPSNNKQERDNSTPTLGTGWENSSTCLRWRRRGGKTGICK